MGKKKLGHPWQKHISQIFLFVGKVAGRAETAIITPLLNLVYLRVCFDFLGKIGKGVVCYSVENLKQKYF